MKINDVAKMTGVTVRTLHYYDQIGLLIPDKNKETKYRLYTEKDLETLQQILFFRELDFSLTEIKEILRNPNFDRKNALLRQRELLKQKQLRLIGLVQLIDGIIDGEKDMSFKEFDCTEIEQMKQQYLEETKERWGETDAYKESQKKISAYTQKEWVTINEKYIKILKEFSKIRMEEPSCERAQSLVKEWQDYITKNYYSCTIEILKGLGMMYVCDERFKKNMDCYGEGTADFISKAIEVYCKNV